MGSVAEAFEWFADWAEGVTPLYERLARETDPGMTTCETDSQTNI